MAAAVVASAVGAAHAEDFSWQVSGAVRRAETGGFDADSWAVDATYFVNPIADDAGPFALASFLNPTTRVFAAATSNDSTEDLFDNPIAYSLGGAYVLPGEKWYVGADYAKANVDDAPPLTLSDLKGYGAQVGRYLGVNTTLELRLGRSEQSSSMGCFGIPFCAGSPLEIEATTDSIGLEVFHVRRFGSLTYALQGSVSERDTEVEFRPSAFLFPTQLDDSAVRQYSIAAELFPTDRLGLRVGYSRPDSDFGLDGYDVGATWYFKPRVAVQFGVSRTTFDDAPPELRHSDSAAVRFIGRL